MPTQRPNDVKLCDECEEKHTQEEGCFDGLTALEELDISKRTGLLTGRELIDKEKPHGTKGC